MNLKRICTLFITAACFSTQIFAANVYYEIDALESKKKELVSARNGNPSQESEILYNAKQEYERACDAIDQELLRIAETDADGNILAEVRKRRLDEKKEIKNQIDQRAQEEIAALKSGDSSFESQLIKEIEQMEKDLKVEREIDSFEDPRILSVKTYAGDKYFWNTVVRFYIDDNQIFSQNVALNYQNVAGKAPASISRADDNTYNDYLDTVDYYDELLKSNDGSIVARINYVVQAMDKSQPSTYKVTINSIKFINTDTNTVIQTVAPVSSSYTFKMQPAVDIRFVSNQGDYSKNKTVTSGSSVSSVQADSSVSGMTGNKTVTSSSAPSREDILSNKDDGRFNLGVMFGNVTNYSLYDLGLDTYTFTAYITVPVMKNLYLSFDLGNLPSPKYFGSFSNADGELFQMSFGGGVNYRLPFKKFHPNIYVGGAVGFATNTYLYNNDYYYGTADEVLLVSKFNCGVDFPIGDLLILTTDYTFWYLEQAGWTYNYNFGVSLNLN